MQGADELAVKDRPASGETPLALPRQEAFARAFAAGATKSGAYAQAGYRPNSSAASRLSKRAHVAARVLALRAQADRAAEAELESVIVLLLSSAARADLSTAAGLREAREARLEAMRLHGELMEERGMG
jgi:hypothetical protein